MQRASHPHEMDPAGRAYAHPHVPCPETRARVLGYLVGAPEPVSGYRTDGTWVWPVSLADELIMRGYGPQRELLSHLTRAGFQPPDTVADQLLDAAAAALRSTPAPPPVVRLEYLLGPESSPAPVVRRPAGSDDSGSAGPGGVTEVFTPCGWTGAPAGFQPAQLTGRYRAVDPDEAAAALDAHCGVWHANQLQADQETVPTAGGQRLARMYDGTAPSGLPWFSPRRRRILEASRRAVIGAYLRGGRLAVRATSSLADPLSDSGEAVVPLGYRTDGVWVWPEGLAYYVQTRGVAPELALLTHIESLAGRPPAEVGPERIRSAAAAVRSGPSPRTDPPAYAYFTAADSPEPLVNAAGAADASREPLLLRAPRDNPQAWHLLTADLRWAPMLLPAPTDLIEITEAEAVRRIDSRWAARTGAAHDSAPVG